MSTEFSDSSMRADGSVIDAAHSEADSETGYVDLGSCELACGGVEGRNRDDSRCVAKRRATRDGVDAALQASTLLDLVGELQRVNEQLREENRRLEQKNSKLARQLERRGRERQYVLDHYEHRLQEANQELEEETDDSGAETRPGRLVDAFVSRVTPD